MSSRDSARTPAVSLDRGEHQAPVLAAESKTVGERRARLPWHGATCHVDVDRRVLLCQPDSGWNRPMPHGERDSDCLDRTGRTEGVAGHPLDAGHHRTGLAEHLTDRLPFGGVVQARRGAMRIDVRDVGRRQTGVLVGPRCRPAVAP